jgi:hypothetical protein
MACLLTDRQERGRGLGPFWAERVAEKSAGRPPENVPSAGRSPYREPNQDTGWVGVVYRPAAHPHETGEPKLAAHRRVRDDPRSARVDLDESPAVVALNVAIPNLANFGVAAIHKGRPSISGESARQLRSPSRAALSVEADRLHVLGPKARRWQQHTRQQAVRARRIQVKPDDS